MNQDYNFLKTDLKDLKIYSKMQPYLPKYDRYYLKLGILDTK